MWRLADPWYLLLLILPLGLLILYFMARKRGRASVLFSGGQYLKGLPTSWRTVVAPHLHWLRYPGLILLVFALARPQNGNNVEEIQTFGVDIMLILDVSDTMSISDMIVDQRKASRLDAAKKVMADFVAGRESDRIGLIAFGTQSLTRCPLTTDYDLVSLALSEITMGLFPKDMRMTAIGNALATGVSRLWKSDAKSRIVILLTDGANTAGNISPTGAADLAASENIRVYTIGFGTPSRTDVDESTLQQIADKTGGRFFRSTTLQDLERVYETINELEKSEVVVTNYEMWDELFPYFLWPGAILLLLEVLFSQIICRRAP